MPKQRILSPEFWNDPDVAELTRDERLLLAGMFTLCADDEGRLLAEPGYLRKMVFGYDEDLTRADVARMTDNIVGTCRNVVRYAFEGQSYIFLKKFAKHQQIRYVVLSKLPPPPEIAAPSYIMPPVAEVSGNLQEIAETSRSRDARAIGESRVEKSREELNRDDLEGEPVLEPPAREPAREAAAPAPRTTALRSVPKTTTPDRNDLAWLEQEVRERAVKAGFDPPTLLAEIDVGDQTNRWHDFEPAAGKGKITWRNWMRLEIDKQLATLKGAKNGSKANGKHNGHQSARERQDQSALAAIQFFGAPPPDGGVPDQDSPAGGPGIPGRSDGGRAGFVDVTPRYLGDRPG